MYCPKCGSNIGDEAKFCPQCGTLQSCESKRTATAVKEPEPAYQVDHSTPLLVLKPVFIPWVTIAGIIPLQIFMTLWGGGFFGGFSMFIVGALGLNLPAWFTFVFFGALFFFGFPILMYVAGKRTTTKTEYRFYPDHLEYAEGFWTAEQKSIKYSDIKEVSMRQGIVQRKHGLGTLHLSTASGSAVAAGHRGFSGILLHNIPNVEEVYQKAKEFVG
jgi:hypothetical protein